jgi:hypothetical protein
MAEQAAFAAIETLGSAMASADPAVAHWLTMAAFAAQCEQVSTSAKTVHSLLVPHKCHHPACLARWTHRVIGVLCWSCCSLSVSDIRAALT